MIEATFILLAEETQKLDFFERHLIAKPMGEAWPSPAPQSDPIGLTPPINSLIQPNQEEDS